MDVPQHAVQQTIEPPTTPKRKRLDRDTRRDILLMRALNYPAEYISWFLRVPMSGVQYTIRVGRATPQRGRGPSKKLSEADKDQLESFVHSGENRYLSYTHISQTLWPERNVGEWLVRGALRERGYTKKGGNRLQIPSGREDVIRRRMETQSANEPDTQQTTATEPSSVDTNNSSPTGSELSFADLPHITTNSLTKESV